MTDPDSRAEFERFAIDRGVGVTIERGPDGEYIDRYIWAMWIGYQAARRTLPSPDAGVVEKNDGALPHNAAYFTCCMDHGPFYYFAPANRTKPPYLRQVEVKAIIDVAEDGTLAGVELVWGPVRHGMMASLPLPPEGTKTDDDTALAALRTIGETEER